MPVYLENRNVVSELAGCLSVLIVPCRICPAISLAVARREPYLEFFKHFLSTPAYVRAIKSLRASLDHLGIRIGVFQSDLPVPMMCMWSYWQRKRLVKHARNYDAAVVLGCDSAVRTVEEVVGDKSFRVFQGMEVKGIIRVTPKFKLPCNISLDIESETCVTWPGRPDAVRTPGSPAGKRPGASFEMIPEK
jgi:hypothetical protein